jgi:hypothetical protein
VKRCLRSPKSDIAEVILVADGEDLAETAHLIESEPEARRERGLALARDGGIRFAMEDPAAVTHPWTPYAVANDDLDDLQACRVIYSPPAYYVMPERA